MKSKKTDALSNPPSGIDIENSDDSKSSILPRSSPHALTIKRRRKTKGNKLTSILNNNDIIRATSSTTDSIGLIESGPDDGDSIELMPITRDTHNNHEISMSQRSIHGQTRTSHAFWNLCKCYVGAASFALPWAVSQTGIIPSITGFILLSSLAHLTFRWMLIASHYASTNANPTYPELAEISFGSFFPLFRFKKNHMQNGSIEMKEMKADNDNDDDDEIQLISHEYRNINDNIDKQLYNYNRNDYIKYNYRCGKCGKIAVYLAMFFGMIGACGSYILFISGVISNWLYAFMDPESSLSFYVSICIVLPFPIMLSLLRSYSFLSSTAKFGVAGVALALLVTAYDGIIHINDGILTQNVIDHNLLYFDLSGFPIFVGNACFLFVIHAMILSQEQSMIDRERTSISTQFKTANNLSLTLVTLINMAFAIFAYISFLDIVPFPDNIVDGLDQGIIQQITRVCLCIDLLFTYALIMYPFTEALDTELFDITQLNSDTGVIFKGNIIRILIVIITAGIAIGIPHFGYLTGLTGGSASIFLGFILPPIFVWKLAPNKIHRFELYILCPIVFLFGCVMFVWSPYLILYQMYS